MTAQYPMRWAYYLSASRFWSRILNAVDIEKKRSVLEIGSGWAPKIPLALSQTAFAGTYTAMDSSSEALHELHSFCDDLFTKFQILYRTESFFTASPSTYDVVILNHVLDDVLLEYHLQQTRRHTLPELYADRGLYIQTWNEIREKDDEYIAYLHPIIATAISKRMNAGGICILTQYPAYQDSLFQFDLPYEISRKFYTTLCKQFSDDKRRNTTSSIGDVYSHEEHALIAPTDIAVIQF